MNVARSVLLVVASLLLGACALAPPPEIAITTDAGIVRAPREGVALETAADLPRLVDALRVELVDTRDDPIEVWVQDEVTLYRGSAMSSDIGGFAHRELDRIHIATSNRAERTLYLAHELVHLLLGEGWQTLPLAVEEGLCDHLALRVTGYDGARLIARHLTGAALAVDELRFTVRMIPKRHARQRAGASWGQVSLSDGPRPLDDWLGRSESVTDAAFDADASVRMRGVGYVLARRILARGGISALHDLCRRADVEGHERVPAEWLLKAAGFDGSSALTDVWRGWTGTAAGSRDVAAMVAAHVDVLAEQIANLLEAKGLAPDAVFHDLALSIAVGDARPRHTVDRASPLGIAIHERLEARQLIASIGR